jgi:DNA-binding response OmpR family regulator
MMAMRKDARGSSRTPPRKICGGSRNEDEPEAGMRVLIAEDDAGLRSVIQRGLSESGYVVDAVVDGEAALSYLRTYEYEVVILDWAMPKVSGVETIEKMRSLGILAPVLMLTARDAPADRAAGLNAGADDYLVKPFDFGELLARLNALQRRPALRHGPSLTCGDLSFDPTSRTLLKGGEAVPLTSIESSLVEVLLRRSPRLVTRRTIALQVWDDEADTLSSNTIDVHMARLRSKLVGSTAVIETVRGSGYRLIE